MKELKLSAPWETYYNEIKALFDGDPGVIVEKHFEGERYEIRLLVQETAKAEAIAELLPEVKNFGNVAVWVTVRPANSGWDISRVLRDAFAGNKNVETVTDGSLPDGTGVHYVVFSDRPAQFFADDLSSCYGCRTLLLQDVAREILKKHNGVYFCTKKVED